MKKFTVKEVLASKVYKTFVRRMKKFDFEIVADPYGPFIQRVGNQKKTQAEYNSIFCRDLVKEPYGLVLLLNELLFSSCVLSFVDKKLFDAVRADFLGHLGLAPVRRKKK